MDHIGTPTMGAKPRPKDHASFFVGGSTFEFDGASKHRKASANFWVRDGLFLRHLLENLLGCFLSIANDLYTCDLDGHRKAEKPKSRSGHSLPTFDSGVNIAY